jgi:hypothetical protein
MITAKTRNEILGLGNIETSPQETLQDAHNKIRRLLAEADAEPGEPNEVRADLAWREQSNAIVKVMLAREIPFEPIDWNYPPELKAG